jgi:hypothetical protein
MIIVYTQRTRGDTAPQTLDFNRRDTKLIHFPSGPKQISFLKTKTDFILHHQNQKLIHFPPKPKSSTEGYNIVFLVHSHVTNGIYNSAPDIMISSKVPRLYPIHEVHRLPNHACQL